jgi:deoxyribodipyrimidine photo-lyase
MKTAIVWFKTDLRLYDNEAQSKQLNRANKFCLFIVFDDSHFETTQYGLKKQAAIERSFTRIINRFRC